MSQNYKIVERLTERSRRKAERAVAAIGHRADVLDIESRDDREAASLIQELGEALSEARAYLSDTISAHHPIDDPAEIALLARFDAILSKLNEA